MPRTRESGEHSDSVGQRICTLGTTCRLERPGFRSSSGDRSYGRVCPIYEIIRLEINLNSFPLD